MWTSLFVSLQNVLFALLAAVCFGSYEPPRSKLRQILQLRPQAVLELLLWLAVVGRFVTCVLPTSSPEVKQTLKTTFHG